MYLPILNLPKSRLRRVTGPLKINFLLLNICLIFDSTKTIRLLALDFYEMVADSGFALIPADYTKVHDSCFS